MKLRTLLLAAVVAASAALPASAACFADYKAKRDQPLQLHYGVIEIPARACDPATAAGIVAGRIARDGWQLLAIVSVFDEGGLDQRRETAGSFFLRY